VIFVVVVAIGIALIQWLLAPLKVMGDQMGRTARLEFRPRHDDESTLAADDGSDRLDAVAPNLYEGDWEDIRPSQMREIAVLQESFGRMNTAIESFTKYVPKDVVKDLIVSKNAGDLTMVSRRCTMLFTDIASFTSICERVPAPLLGPALRVYFERCSAVIMECGGIVDKFIGDAVMAVFGAPFPVDNQELRGALCARLLFHDTTTPPLSTAFSDLRETLNVRAGVATGDVLAGNMGCRERMSYTVIGDEVNLASRLEGLNKQWGTNVMVAQETAEEIAEFVSLRYVVSINVVGKAKPVRVYEVVGLRDDAPEAADGSVFVNDASTAAQDKGVEIDPHHRDEAYLRRTSVTRILQRCRRRCKVTPEQKAWATHCTKAMTLFEKGDFAATMSLFQELSDTTRFPPGAAEHLSVKRIYEKCEECIREPPGKDWTGSWVAAEK